MNEEIVQNVHQPHYIQDPKRYISGMATHPPPTSDDEENENENDISMINIINKKKKDYFNVNDIEVDYTFDECKLCTNNIIKSDDNKGSNKSQAERETVNAFVSLIDRVTPNESESDYDYSEWFTSDDDDSDDIDTIVRKPKYVQVDKHLPPNLSQDKSAGILNANTKLYTNCNIQQDRIANVNHDQVLQDVSTIRIYPNENEEYYYNSFSDTYYHVLALQNHDLKDVWYGIKNIPTTNDQWYIHVPVTYEDGTTIKTPIFADPGANSACVSYDWAYEH